MSLQKKQDIMFNYDKNAKNSEETRNFTVGLGCFWGVEAKFASMEGVVRTSCGYAGGSEPNPSYSSIKDHTEVVQVEYDSDVTSYRKLVEKSIEINSPSTGNRGKKQYDNIIFYTNPSEYEIIKIVIRENGYDVQDIETRIEKLGDYYPAEDYHQKYNLRSNRVLEENFLSEYTEEEIRRSALATKVNAFASGNITKEELPDLEDFDLSSSIYDKIARRFR
jgi:peptide-methionine (S)-S-oxide reductase